jgi:hypothetical protein
MQILRDYAAALLVVFPALMKWAARTNSTTMQ